MERQFFFPKSLQLTERARLSILQLDNVKCCLLKPAKQNTVTSL